MRTVILSVLLAGCQLPEGLPSAKEAAPKVSFDKLRIDAISFDKVDTTFVLDVANPYPVQIPVKAFTWDLDVAGSSFADGKSSEGLTIGAQKTSKVKIPVSAAFQDVLAVGKATRGVDSVPFEIQGDLSFDTPLGPLTLPYDAKGDFPALRAPKFSPKGLRVEKLDVAKQTARLAVDFDVTSEQGSSLSFPKFAYGLKLGGKQVATGQASVPVVDEAASFTLPVDVNLVTLGTAIAGAITKKTDLQVGLTADADVSTPFGVVPLAIREERTVPVR